MWTCYYFVLCIDISEKKKRNSQWWFLSFLKKKFGEDGGRI